jgi:hypothetical protein
MAKMTYDLHVELDDGTEYDVRADQRDVAKWEMQPFGSSFFQVGFKPHAFMRYVAWSGARRAEQTTLSWDQFDAQCVEVSDRTKPEAVADAEDPTSPAA